MEPIANVSEVFKAPDFREEFILTMRIAMQAAKDIAEAHGFDSTKIEDGTSIALMHSEVSEMSKALNDTLETYLFIARTHEKLSDALEALRHSNPKSDHIPQFSAVEEELADLAIRLFHYSCMHVERLPEAILCKMDYNATKRPYKHGKAF